jgi:hypothetical protein
VKSAHKCHRLRIITIDAFPDVLLGLREEASKFGVVSSIRPHRNHVYLEFPEVSSAKAAFNGMDAAVFYPACLWRKGVWWSGKGINTKTKEHSPKKRAAETTTKD